ncbi:MAG: RagB/SusD family nutrient uptake outer membrane protein [Tannerella sp.]|jgi:hypothetical protein|nr:RagB/SusD family nutrient uptake outer membrane protein [Tannerella sp.]
MKSKYIFSIIAGLCLSLGSCDDFLDRKPLNIISDADVWANESSVLAYLAQMYDDVQMETNKSMGVGEGYVAHFTDESMRSYTWGVQHNPTFPDNFLNNYNDVYGQGYDDPWAYGKIRRVHEFMEKIPEASLSQTLKDRYMAEAYFLRAFEYFTMVKRFGGVPLIREAQQLTGDIDELKVPRSTEEEMWNFIAEDLDKAIAGLPETVTGAEQFRATKYAAYALKSRAMLYAGSIARYGQVQIGGLTGIPADKANAYFSLSLAAAEAIIGSGKYSLYDKTPDDRAANFQNLFMDQTMHEEAIFVKAYSADKGHSFDMMCNPEGIGTGWTGSACPTGELIEEYEYADGTPGALKISDADGKPIYYDHPEDLFAGKEPRFHATVLYPGCTFGGQLVEIRRGIIGSDGEKVSAVNTTARFEEDPSLTVGGRSGMYVGSTPTGFFLRKYIDPAMLTTASKDRSTSNFLVFRYGETLLNYAEAAVELGGPNDALPKLNAVRARAGVPPKTSVTMDDIRHERQVELAFENLRVWDLIRWRIYTKCATIRYSPLSCPGWTTGTANTCLKKRRGCKMRQKRF